jgi:acyl carrier protein
MSHNAENGNNGKIRGFLSKYFGDKELRDDEDIFAGGFVNSLFAMQLVLFLESEFGIQLDNDDLNLDNFRSVEALLRLIDRKSSSSAGRNG